MSEEKIKVALANDSFPPLIDGVANTVVNYARVISEKYGRAIVATPKYRGVTDDYPFEVVRFPSLNTVKIVGYRTGLPFDPICMERMTNFAPDIVHSHCPLISTYLCRELRASSGAPLVFTYHTKFDMDLDRAFKLGVIKNIGIKVIIENISACDEVWVVNKGAGENLRSLGYTGEYRLMPNGVEFPAGEATEAETAALDAQYGFDRSVPVFLFVGRMMWYKGQRIIIDALRKIADAGFGFRMVFIGDGDNLDEMKSYADNIGIADKTVFTGAIRDREMLRAWYTRADMFLLPSVFDNNPIVVKEASACGTASVLVKDSSSAEGVTDGVNGILIEENSDSMAAALEKLCRDRALARRLGEAALRDLYVSWDDRIAEAVSRYKELLEASRKGELPHKKKSPMDVAIDIMADSVVKLDAVRHLLKNEFTDD